MNTKKNKQNHITIGMWYVDQYFKDWWDAINPDVATNILILMYPISDKKKKVEGV